MARLNYILIILIVGGVVTIYFSTINVFSISSFTSQITSTINEEPFEQLSPSSLLHLNQTIKRIAAIDRIFLINLPARTDRRTTAIALFQTLHLDIHIVPALHPQSPEVLSRRHRHHRLTQLELACWASHMQLWTHIALTSTSNDSWTLIFEDDVDVEMSMVEIVESFPKEVWAKAEMIYLGYCGNPRGELVFKGRDPYQIHRAVNPSCTHAYAIHSRSLSKLIHLTSVPDEAVDDQIVRFNNQGKLLIYSIHPPLALQRPKTIAHPFDVNPLRKGWAHSIERKFNHLVESWQGVEFMDQLHDSALAHADLFAADQWRRQHEMSRWNVSRSIVKV